VSGWYFIFHPLKFFKLFWRASGRVGLFAKFYKEGYSDVESRFRTDKLAPPSKEQLEFEAWWNNKND
tara:strand:- start:8 stop:208 length:201 start_codon:yes stop_codon:yes gene_type:complete